MAIVPRAQCEGPDVPPQERLLTFASIGDEGEQLFRSRGSEFASLQGTCPRALARHIDDT